MIEIWVVYGDQLNPIGLEIKLGDQIYFIASNQDYWQGIRLGQFPVGKNGKPYDKTKILSLKNCWVWLQEKPKTFPFIWHRLETVPKDKNES